MEIGKGEVSGSVPIHVSSTRESFGSLTKVTPTPTDTESGREGVRRSVRVRGMSGWERRPRSVVPPLNLDTGVSCQQGSDILQVSLNSHPLNCLPLFLQGIQESGLFLYFFL